VSHHSGWKSRALLVGVGVLLGLLLSELVVRLAGPVLPANFSTRALQERHGLYGVFHRRGGSAWIRDPEFTTFVRFNSAGLRGPEISPAPAADTTRILVLGDSFVEGSEVHENETLPAQLAEEMSRTSPTEALNAGVRGWGTAQEYLYLVHEGLQLQPDVVVFVLYVGNDLADNSQELSSAAPNGQVSRPTYTLEHGALVPHPVTLTAAPAWAPLLASARSRSSLFNLMEGGVATKLAYADQEEVLRSTHRQVFANPPPPAWERSWRVTESLIAAARDAAEHSGAQFIMVIAPHKAQLDATEWERLIRGSPVRGTTWDQSIPVRRLTSSALESGVHAIDLLPTLQAAPDPSSLYFAENSHWTARGHRLVAQTIAKHLTRESIGYRTGRRSD
jgi:hypothetical protein